MYAYEKREGELRQAKESRVSLSLCKGGVTDSVRDHVLNSCTKANQLASYIMYEIQNALKVAGFKNRITKLRNNKKVSDDG